MSTPIPIFDSEDPKLTAYALGELTDPAERAEVELLLRHSQEARAALSEIEDTVLVLAAEYDEERRMSSEPAERLTPGIIELATRSPEHRWGWVRPLLAAAAIILATVALASLRPAPRRYLASGIKSVAQSAPTTQALGTVTEISPAAELADPATEAVLPETEQGKAAGAGASSTTAAATPVNVEELRAKVALLDRKLMELRRASPMMRVDPRQEMDTRQPGATPLPASPAGLAPVADATKEHVQAQFAQVNEPAQITLKVTDGRRVDALRAQSNLEKDSPVGVLTDPLAAVAPAPNTPVVPPIPAVASAKFQPPQSRVGTVASATQPGAKRGVTSTTAFARGGSGYDETTFGYLAQATGDREMPGPDDALSRADASRASRLIVSKSSVEFNTAAYDHLVENPFLGAKENPLSTFSVDVDTASYANVRRFIESGALPPPDAVRLEELINYFPYDYAPPAVDSGKPFAVHLEAAACPWTPEHRLVRIGLKGKEIARDKRPASNLVFLLDVSGSMQPPERLPLIKQAMRMLTEQLTESDHVAIVTYAGNSGLVLPSTSGDHKDAILGALDRLEAGGSTNGASGITLAYEVARKGFIKGGTNRVILATDGDFNVGMTSQGDLIRLIQEQAKSGVFLSALGVGTDNYKDSTMQKLADKGNGNYNYLDRLEEARKVLVEQMGGTLVTIAKDVKIQVEFNPAVVAAYRLIGYEKRALKKEDFNDDKIDAGEIGAGHSVTALYEVVPAGQPTPGETPAVDALKYAAQTDKAAPKAESAAVTRDAGSPEMLTVKLRHKAPDADTSERLDEMPLIDGGAPGDFAKASPDFKFAAAVAAFGLALRDSPYKGGATLGAAVELAQEGKGTDVKEYRAQFIALARRAQEIKDAR